MFTLLSPLKLITWINDQKFVLIGNKLNEIKIPLSQDFCLWLCWRTWNTRVKWKNNQRVTRKALSRRPWLSRGPGSKLKNTWEGKEVEARMFTGLFTLPRPCISCIPWWESRKAVVLWDSCDISAYVPMWLHAYVYTYNTSKKLTVSQTNHISIMCLGLGCV